MQVRKMRVFRHKYKISRPELGNACGLSPQRISEIELNTGGLNEETASKLTKAFEAVIRTRRAELSELEGDFIWHKDSLFEVVEETSYEL